MQPLTQAGDVPNLSTLLITLIRSYKPALLSADFARRRKLRQNLNIELHELGSG